MSTKNPHIAALIDVLDVTLSEAAHLVHVARDAMQYASQNQAIGTLQPLAGQLENAVSLYRVIVSLHARQPKAGGQP